MRTPLLQGYLGNHAPSLRGRGWGRGHSLFLMFSFFFSQNYTEEQKSQRRTETLSQPITQSITAHVKGSGPSPNPSPEGKGRNHRDTPIMRVYASFYPLISSLIGVTSHTTPLPCGGGVGGGATLSFSCSPFFLTELHRRTEITKVHRDIKSTDITERYNQRQQ